MISLIKYHVLPINPNNTASSGIKHKKNILKTFLVFYWQFSYLILAWNTYQYTFHQEVIHLKVFSVKSVKLVGYYLKIVASSELPSQLEAVLEDIEDKIISHYLWSAQQVG